MILAVVLAVPIIILAIHLAFWLFMLVLDILGAIIGPLFFGRQVYGREIFEVLLALGFLGGTAYGLWFYGPALWLSFWLFLPWWITWPIAVIALLVFAAILVALLFGLVELATVEIQAFRSRRRLANLERKAARRRRHSY